MTINSKKKGNLWENKLAKWLSSKGIKAWKDSASGGGSREKADIGNNFNLHIECKAVKAINLKKVWDKAVIESNKTHNIPHIFIHFDGMIDDEYLVVLHSEDWAELFKQAWAPKTIQGELSRSEKYKVDKLIQSAKEVLKLYGQ